MSAPNLGASWQWGQSTTLEILNTSPQKGAQVLNVSLPVPAVCAIYLRASIMAGSIGTIWSMTFDVTVGVGRTSLRRSFSYLNQPTPLTALEVIIPAQPLTALQCDVTVLGNAGPSIQLDVGAELAPVTWIPSSESSLQFGMALPGEADGLDDDAYDEIQEDNPELVEQMREAQEEGAPFPSLDYVEEHASRYARHRLRRAPGLAAEHGEQVRRRLRNWNGRNGR